MHISAGGQSHFSPPPLKKYFPSNLSLHAQPKMLYTLFHCPCGLQYIGRTVCMLQTRLAKHATNIKKGFPKHSLFKHYALWHGCNPEGTTFLGIDTFTGHWSGSNAVGEISRLETRWIYQAQTYALFGMNIEWDINSFINNSWCDVNIVLFWDQFHRRCLSNFLIKSSSLHELHTNSALSTHCISCIYGFWCTIILYHKMALLAGLIRLL